MADLEPRQLETDMTACNAQDCFLGPWIAGATSRRELALVRDTNTTNINSLSGPKAFKAKKSLHVKWQLEGPVF